MIALLQRVTKASVTVVNQEVAKISNGILVFTAVEDKDDDHTVQRMSNRILGYRIFSDAADKMNKSVVDINGELLIIPQFTLAAVTNKGLRPNFSNAASPEKGKIIFDQFLNTLNLKYDKVKSGIFAADMQVHLINDGPVTFWLEQ